MAPAGSGPLSYSEPACASHGPSAPPGV